MITVDKRQKEQHSFNLRLRMQTSFTLMGFNHIKSVLLSECHPEQPFSASNTDSTPTTVNISRSPSLSDSVAYIIVHLCIYITLPRQLFRSCCVGAEDLRQSKALLTPDPQSLSLSHTHAHANTRIVTHMT